MRTNIRKILKIPALLFTVVLLAAGCASDDDAGQDTGGKVPVKLYSGGENAVAHAVASAMPGTRTAPGGESWLQTDKIGVFMLSENGNLPLNILTVGKTTADNIMYSVTPGDIDASKAEFHPADTDETIYYPRTGKVDIIAYYPWRAPSATPYVYSVDVTDQEDPGQIDVLYAKITGVEKTAAAVNLDFAHKMSKVTLNVKAGGGVAPADIAALAPGDVVFSGMPQTANIALQAGTVTAGAAGTGIDPKKETAASGYDATFSAILVPHGTSFTGRKAVFTVAGKDYTWPLGTADVFTEGNHYIYSVTVKETGISIENCTITDWAGISAAPGEGNVKLKGIHTPADLVLLSSQWNATADIPDDTERAARQAEILAEWSDNGLPDGTIRLHNNIDMSGIDFIPIGGWIPYPRVDYGFTGNFDGGGHTVSNLTIDSNLMNIGMFGRSHGTISNIILSDCDITAMSNCGAITGSNLGIVTGCSVTGGSVTATSAGAAGIAADNYGEISDCIVYGTSIRSPQYSGGIAGTALNGSYIADCLVVEATVETQPFGYCGGIAGSNRSVITGCSVVNSTLSSNTVLCGGIAGHNSMAIAVISACCVIGGEMSAPTLGGICANSSNDGEQFIIGCYIVGTTITAVDTFGGIMSSMYSGGISGCIASPGDVNAPNKGGIVGNGSNPESKIDACYWAEKNAASAVGTGTADITGGGSFDSDGDINAFFTTSDGTDTPIGYMNKALEDSDTPWRWKPGTAASGWYPVLYQP